MLDFKVEGRKVGNMSRVVSNVNILRFKCNFFFC